MKKIFGASVNVSSLNFWLLILRLAIGCFMLTHGLSKLQKLLAGKYQFADPFGLGSAASLGLAVFAEFFCSILLILGLATRLATIPLITTMLVAVMSAHAADPFAKKELALLYLLIYLTILVAGPGKFSVDALINKPGRR